MKIKKFVKKYLPKDAYILIEGVKDRKVYAETMAGGIDFKAAPWKGLRVSQVKPYDSYLYHILILIDDRMLEG